MKAFRHIQSKAVTFMFISFTAVYCTSSCRVLTKPMQSVCKLQFKQVWSHIVQMSYNTVNTDSSVRHSSMSVCMRYLKQQYACTSVQPLCVGSVCLPCRACLHEI